MARRVGKRFLSVAATVVVLAACGGTSGGTSGGAPSAPSEAASASTTEPRTSTSTPKPSSAYADAIAAGLLAFTARGGVSLDAADAACAGAVVAEAAGPAALQAHGSPAAVEASVAAEGTDAIVGELSVGTREALAECVGPAHMLEDFVAQWAGASGLDPVESTFRVGDASEACLRERWHDDAAFREHFLDFEAMPLTWMLQVEGCLTDDEVAGLFGAEPPSTQPAFLFDAAGPAEWWPGGAIAVCGDDPAYRGTTLFVLDPASGGTRHIASAGCDELDRSPDGTALVYGGVENPDGMLALRIVGVDGTGDRALTTPPVGHAPIEGDSQPAWSPDGQWIAFHRGTSGAEGVYLVRTDGTGLRRVASGGWPTWSPDSARLVVTSVDGLTLVDVTTGATSVLVAATDDREPGAPVWSPAGDTLAYLDTHEGLGVVRLWSPSAGDRGAVPGLDGVGIDAVRWSPDGAWLLLDGDANIGLVIVRPSGADAHRIGALDHAITAYAWLASSAA